MDTDYIKLARTHVFVYIQSRLEKTDTHVTFGLDEVYVVWFSKVLQNWKALVSTTLPDGMYYEITFNGDRQEMYIDAYKKFDNVCIPYVDDRVIVPGAHSRACGIKLHEHGIACHRNCPTCHGSPTHNDFNELGSGRTNG